VVAGRYIPGQQAAPQSAPRAAAPSSYLRSVQVASEQLPAYMRTMQEFSAAALCARGGAGSRPAVALRQSDLDALAVAALGQGG
jgi:hypothetical protein